MLQTPEPVRGGRRRILVVDDDPLAAAALRLPLLEHAFDVVTLGSGAEALEWLRTEHADLIILDVIMPGLSGLEVCRRIRLDGVHHSVPVLLVTARDGLEDMVEGRLAGSDLYLRKPLPAFRLIEMVEMFLPGDLAPARRPSSV